MKKSAKGILWIFFQLIIAQQGIFAQQADLILLNGKIFTSDTSQLYVQALAISGNKILATGDNESVKKLSGSHTRQIDLGGRTVIPGFNDAHDHLGFLLPLKQSFFTPFSLHGPSKAAVVDSILRLSKRAAGKEWIQGTMGIDVFLDTSIRRRLLDSISPNNPVALLSSWGHGMILNSRALAAAHISDTEPDPVSGWYERIPATRHLTGALWEGAQFPVLQVLALSDKQTLIKTLHEHAQEELRFGITTVQDMCTVLNGNAAREIFAKAKLPVRVRVIAMPGSTAKGRSLAEWEEGSTQITPLTYVSGIKYVLDGTPNEETGLNTTPYPGQPERFGRLNYPVDTIRQMLFEALHSHRQLMIHISGDSVTKIVIRLMRSMADDETWKSKRVRIEHGVSIRLSDTKDIKDLGIVVVHTPQYGLANPIRTWLDAGIPVAVGPDALINPYLGILSMTTRQLDPHEKITVEQAVICYTRNAAFAEFAEDSKGTLAPGKLADLAVLSQDIFTITSSQLLATHSLLTMVDGKIVWDELHL